ncbi:MAG: NAD(P)H-dependent oxidoreductase subunit E [Parvularculaceae bacterium]|nr:NAD(P)H-dependent oxidoreductase subunit E [Parvularculaceae bacterium]
MGGTSNKNRALDEIVRPYVGRTGGLICALRAIQAEIGFLPPETEAAAAAAFNLTRAEVKGVISFYADFVRKPKGETVIRLCAAEACQAQGARSLEMEVCRRLAIEPGATSASGDLTLERVYCLGLCSAGPSAIIDGALMGKATPEKIVKAFETGRGARK